jgi:N12 class adenine-specific DNA methylase
MIPLATIHLGDERQSFDVNALFLDASTILYAWDSTGDKLVVRCFLNASEAVAYVCEVIRAATAATTATAPSTTPSEPSTEPATEPLGYPGPITDLTGDVVAKLAVAKTAGPRFTDLAARLVEVQPAPVPFSDISVGLGAVWVPAAIYREWLYSLFVGLDWGLSVERSPSGVWLVTCTNPTLSQLDAHVRTPRMSSLDLIAAAMNNQVPVVLDASASAQDSGPGGAPLAAELTPVARRPLRNEPATLEAQARMQELRQRFDSWVGQDSSRAESLAAIYNERFNRFAPRCQQHELTTPPVSIVKHKRYVLRSHQLRGVARIIEGGTYDRSAYLVYAPGDGKTDPAIVATEELRAKQTGRTLIAVPASVIGQWRERYRELYPKASRLLAYNGRTSSDRRQFWIDAMSAQVLIVSHEMLREPRLSLAALAAIRADELAELRQALRDAECDASASARDMVRQARRVLRERESDARAELKTHAQSIEGRPIWDALQIEHLILDEAHFAKSLGTKTRMEHVSGLPTGESARAVDCWVKCQVVMRSSGRVTALSGTPLTNSLAEAHVWMRMLQPRLLAHVGLTRFDDWASVFAEAVPTVEMDCVGRFRSQTRLRFRNVPELLKLLGECWDFVSCGLLVGGE